MFLLYLFPLLTSTLRGPFEFPQVQETARTPTKYIVGKDKFIISYRDNHDGDK